MNLYPKEEPTDLDIALAAADAGNAGHWPTVAGILADEYRKVEKERELLKAQRDTAINMLAEWCVAVENDSSWDGWDGYYKDARWGDCSIRELLDAEIKRAQD